MKKIRKIMLFVLIILGFTITIDTINVKAETAPSTIKMKSKSKLYYYSEDNGTDYISGYNFYRKELTDGTLAYCISNVSKGVPAGDTMKLSGKITDKGLRYIIMNGYPHKSITGNKNKDYYITQSAIWKYFDETRGSKNWPNTTFSSSSSTMKRAVYNLVQGAKAARKAENNVPEPKITINVDNYNMTLTSDLKYFISSPVKVELQNTTGTYTVNLKNAPDGTVIKNLNGEETTTFNNEESFVIYVPATSSEGSCTVVVSAKNITYEVYDYKPSDSKDQHIAPVTLYEEITNSVSEELVFKFKKEITKVKISKQDITTKKELPGATLVIKDKNGKVIEEWISTNEPHYIEGLEPGEYTLTETIAPEGYVLSEETISFKVLLDGTTTNVVMYNEPYITKVKISKLDIVTNEEVAGATLVIKDKDGKVIEEWVSTTEPHYIEGLKPGEYTLTETIAPEGYVLSEEIVEFTVKANGEVTTAVMYNAKESNVTKVKISKQDITTKEEVAGATLVIKDKDGNIIEEWVSTTEPHYIEGLEPGEYTLTETIAPEGYVLSRETVEFIVKDDGSVTNVIMYNEKYVEVPITDLNVNSLVVVFASILMILGTSLVVYYAKYSKEK